MKLTVQIPGILTDNTKSEQIVELVTKTSQSLDVSGSILVSDGTGHYEIYQINGLTASLIHAVSASLPLGNISTDPLRPNIAVIQAIPVVSGGTGLTSIASGTILVADSNNTFLQTSGSIFINAHLASGNNIGLSTNNDIVTISLSSSLTGLGSISASYFTGSGAALTNLTASQIGGLQAYIRSNIAGSGSITISNGTASLNSNVTASNYSASGYFYGDGSKLTNISLNTFNGIINVNSGGTGISSFNGNSIVIASGTAAFTSLTGSDAADGYAVIWDKTKNNYILGKGGIDVTPIQEGEVLISSGSKYKSARISSGSNIVITYDSGSTTVALKNDLTNLNSLTSSYARIQNNLYVDGTASIGFLNTINVDEAYFGDKYIVILSGADTHTSLDGSGIQWGSGSAGPTVDDRGANAHIRFKETYDSLEVFPRLTTDYITASYINILSSAVGQFTGSFSGSIVGNITSDAANITGVVKNLSSGTPTYISASGPDNNGTGSISLLTSSINYNGITINLGESGSIPLVSDIVASSSILVSSSSLSGTVYINLNKELNGLTISGSTFSGSHSGSYIGDGSGVTGVLTSSFATSALTASYINPLTQSVYINGSLSASSGISGSFSGSGLSLQLTASQIDDLDKYIWNNITGSGSVTVSGGTASLNDIVNISTLSASTAISASKYYGDGSSLFGLITNIYTTDGITGSGTQLDPLKLKDSISITNAVTASYFVGNGQNITGLDLTHVSGVLTTDHGGTGLSSFTTGALYIATSTSTLSPLTGSDSQLVGWDQANSRWIATDSYPKTTYTVTPGVFSVGHIVALSGGLVVADKSDSRKSNAIGVVVYSVGTTAVVQTAGEVYVSGASGYTTIGDDIWVGSNGAASNYTSIGSGNYATRLGYINRTGGYVQLQINPVYKLA